MSKGPVRSTVLVANDAGQGGLARGRAFAVLNMVQGSFEHFKEDPDYLWLSSEAEAGRLGFAVLPRCEGEVLPLVEAGAISLAEAMTISPGRFAERTRVTPLRAIWSLCSFAAFAVLTLDAFAGHGLVPAPVREWRRLSSLESVWVDAATRARFAILVRVEAGMAGRVGLTPGQVMDAVDGEDARMLTELFPDLLTGIVTEVALAAGRREISDFTELEAGIAADHVRMTVRTAAAERPQSRSRSSGRRCRAQDRDRRAMSRPLRMGGHRR